MGGVGQSAAGLRRVGMVGVGRMGRAIAARLAERGHAVYLHDARPEALAADPIAGATVVDRATALRAEVVVTMVPDDAAVASVWLEPSDALVALRDDAVHVCMSSISYPLGRRLAAAHSAAGRAYVAAPLFGRPPLAQRGELDVIVAGHAEAIERCGSVFADIGRQVFTVGTAPEQANLVKIARNFLVASTIESLGEAIGLCGRAGMDTGRFLQVLLATSLGSPAVRYYGEYCVNRSTETLLPMHLGLKDVSLALDAAAELDLPMPNGDLLADRMREAIAEGWGERDWAALAEWIGSRRRSRAAGGEGGREA